MHLPVGENIRANYTLLVILSNHQATTNFINLVDNPLMFTIEKYILRVITVNYRNRVMVDLAYCLMVVIQLNRNKIPLACSSLDSIIYDV